MNKSKIVKILGLATFVVICLICPLIYKENTAISLLFSQNANLSVNFYLIIASAFSLLLASLICICFDKELPALFLSGLSLVGFVFCKYFTDETIRNIPLIIFNCLVFGYSYYKSVNKFSLTIQDITEIGVLVALAIVLDLTVKIRIGSNGGSISFVMVPLFIIALRKGFFKGFIATGIVFGLINCLMDGYGLFTYQFDYLLGFGSLAVIGLFRPLILNKEHRLKIMGFVFIAISVILGAGLRLLASTASGMIFYYLDFVASLEYNVLYIGPSAICAVVALFILYKPLLMIDKKFPNAQ